MLLLLWIFGVVWQTAQNAPKVLYKKICAGTQHEKAAQRAAIFTTSFSGDPSVYAQLHSRCGSGCGCGRDVDVDVDVHVVGYDVYAFCFMAQPRINYVPKC